MLRKLWYNIQNILYWFPVIWRDRQWDHTWFYQILEHKLRAMEKWYSSDKPWAVGANKLAKQIGYCRRLTSRLVEDRYLLNQLLIVDRKWGDSSILSHPEGIVYVYDGLGFEKAATEEERIVAERLFRKCGNEAHRQRQQDIEELFKLLAKYAELWWD